MSSLVPTGGTQSNLGNRATTLWTVDQRRMGRHQVSREDDLQMSIVQDLRSTFSDIIVHFSDSLTDSKIGGQKLKAMGKFAGFPDLTVVVPGAVMFLEVKRRHGPVTVSPVQKACHARLRELGHTVVVVRSEAQAIEAVRDKISSVMESAIERLNSRW